MIAQTYPETDYVSDAFRRAEIVREVSKSEAARSGNSFLSKAIQQITAPNWWNDPTEPWKSNRKRLNETAELRAKFIKSFERRRKPVGMEQLAKEFDCSVAKIRALAGPFVESGSLVRGVNEEKKVTLEKSR